MGHREGATEKQLEVEGYEGRIRVVERWRVRQGEGWGSAQA